MHICADLTAGLNTNCLSTWCALCRHTDRVQAFFIQNQTQTHTPFLHHPAIQFWTPLVCMADHRAGALFYQTDRVLIATLAYNHLFNSIYNSAFSACTQSSSPLRPALSDAGGLRKSFSSIYPNPPYSPKPNHTDPSLVSPGCPQTNECTSMHPRHTVLHAHAYIHSLRL